VRVTAAEPIGADYGLSGRTYRLRIEGTGSAPPTIVAKFEDGEKLRRAVAFREENEERFASWLPASYGFHVDLEADRGILLMEDIAPATQGDDLIGCTPAQADTMVNAIATLHGATWQAPGHRLGSMAEDRAVRDWEPERWNDRLTRAAARYPEVISARVVQRLSDFPVEAATAYDELDEEPCSWTHRDPHPDNALWRTDGTIVMLDWSGAAVAPPAIDVGGLLFGLCFRADPPLRATDVTAAYVATIRRLGVTTTAGDIERTAKAAVRLLVRGTLGWTGIDTDPPPAGRILALRDQQPGRIVAALDWLDD
jgi:hypothetical protein